MANVPWFSLLTMVTISASLSFMADAQDCFGGIETFEKMVSMSFSGGVSYKSMLQQPGQAITRDCINLCKQQAACLSFALNYTSSSCISYNVNSVGRGEDLVLNKAVNFFEKICFRGVSKQAFDSACRDRLWVFDRVRDAYLEGHVDKEARNVRTKEDCEKLCITEERFKCRSADYDEVQHTCRMSRETRRTKPNAFRIDPGSGRNYLENQCAPPPPASCRYETKSDVTLLTPDYLQFAASATDCMDQCDAETAFNCWSYSYVDNRCQLSSDSSVTWGRDTALPIHPGAVYGEMKCFFEQCDNGVLTFEKMTGVLLRSAQGTMMKVSKAGALGNTLECAKICLEDGTECPAFSDHYHNMRCDRLDRNSNGRTQELIARDGESYFEKICLQGPEAQTCSDKAWAFERALGYELADNLYQKTIDKVETRTTCIQLCLSEREFTCRSARYDEESGECKLSPADRRTEPMKYYRSEDARVSYLENSCLPVDTTCPYVETEDAYPTYANIIQTEGVSTLESCRDLCNNLKRFSCRSFSYYSSALQCFLSGDDKASGGSAAIQRRPGIIYYERMCPQVSTLTDLETTLTSTHSTLRHTQPQFQEKETTVKTRPPYQPQEPSRAECSPTERLIFEKLTGYEPFGVTSTLLYRGDSSTPGITAECIRRCQTLSDCGSFILDHQRFECSSIQDPPNIHPADFRSSIGKTYFGGLCVPAYVGCSKLWVYERMMDQELKGLVPIDVVRVVSLEQCQQHCLETRKYVCRSANYFHLRRECHIFGDDRSAPKAQLAKSSRVDFFENQCLVESSFCPYQKSEENQAMIYVSKSLANTPSTLHCERECNREREFNCRSYTFWDQGARGSVCMLSGESRLTGQGMGILYRGGATYSGKNCKITISDRASTPHSDGTKGTHPPKGTEIPPYKTLPPPPPYKPPPVLPPMPPPMCSINQFTYEKVMGHDVRGGRRERIPTRVPIGVVQACQAECQRLGERCQGFVVQYKSYQNCYVILRDPTDDAILVPSLDSVYFNKVCLREKPCKKIWSFERYIHHEFHGETLFELSEVLERADCEDLCLRERPNCKSAVYNYHDRTCRMYTETRRSAASQFLYSNEEVEYLENQCVSESPTCQYRDFPDRFLPQIERLSRAFNLKDCQRQCDTERDFICRSLNFEMVAKDCALSSEDVTSVPQGIAGLKNRRNSLYSEKGNCEQVSVQCNPHDMLLTIHFDSPFHGRVYAKGNPSQCFVVGTGQNSLQFAISMGSRCGTMAETSDQFVNEVVVQQHPVIMTDHDKTIKVVCSFETLERTYTMAGPGVGAPGGVDVARTYMKAPLTAVVTNTAPPPNVAMRVLDQSGRDARTVGLGEELVLKIELREASSAFAIFARNLYARSSNGESLFLIDSSGCPTDAAIFPALVLDPQDQKSLHSTFKAFRFPSSGMVNFEVQIRFCQEKCEQVQCGVQGVSHGKKKRDLWSEVLMPFNSSLDDEDVYFDHDSYDTVQAVVQDEAHSIILPLELNNSRENEAGFNPTTNTYFEAKNDGKGTITSGNSRMPEMDDETTALLEKSELNDSIQKERANKAIKKHLMPEMNKENMLSVVGSNQSVMTSTETKYTTKRSVHPTFTSHTNENNEFSSEKQKNDNQGYTEKGIHIGITDNSKITNSITTEIENAHNEPAKSFNRKFAFIHNEEANNTTSYTRTNAGHHSDGNGAKFNADASNQYLPRVSPEARKDHFSAISNPYSSILKNIPSRKKDSFSERVQPLPQNVQKLVDNSQALRPWNVPKSPGTDAVPGQSHIHPLLQSQSIEIHEVPYNRDNIHKPLPNANYNILNTKDDNHQAHGATAIPEFQGKPQEIPNSNTNAWGSPSQHTHGMQIQRPLDNLDHQGQRRDKLPEYPRSHHQGNQPRPIEITHNPFRSDSYTDHMYDYNRHPMHQPRPVELTPNSSPQWNINNKVNIPPSISVHSIPSANKWVSNFNGMSHTINQKRPEEMSSSRQHFLPQQASHPNSKQVDDRRRTHNEQNSAGRKEFYASKPQYRPSEVVATTQKSVPEEVPLSLAILVGEDSKSQNSAQQKPKHHWRSLPQYNRGLQRHNIINTPRPEATDDDKVCTSRATIIATAVSVTLVYLGAAAGAIIGYKWHRKNKRRKTMSTNPAVHFPTTSPNANVTYSTPDVTFRNVYGNFPVNSASTT